MSLSQMLVQQVITFASTHAYLQIPENAAGQCWEMSETFYYEQCSGLLEVIETRAPDIHILDTGQYSDHYALYDPESDMVIDFTMRQFKEDVDFPLICSKDEWGKILAEAWKCSWVYMDSGHICEHCSEIGDCSCGERETLESFFE